MHLSGVTQEDGIRRMFNATLLMSIFGHIYTYRKYMQIYLCKTLLILKQFNVVCASIRLKVIAGLTLVIHVGLSWVIN